jgi:hypothetical protein
MITVTAIFCFAGNETTMLPFGISGIIAAIGAVVVCVELVTKSETRTE